MTLVELPFIKSNQNERDQMESINKYTESAMESINKDNEWTAWVKGREQEYGSAEPGSYAYECALKYAGGIGELYERSYSSELSWDEEKEDWCYERSDLEGDEDDWCLSDFNRVAEEYGGIFDSVMSEEFTDAHQRIFGEEYTGDLDDPDDDDIHEQVISEFRAIFAGAVDDAYTTLGREEKARRRANV